MTGATGGVGSVAIALLTAAGFKVVAATGKLSEEQYLKQLGAVTVLDRAELTEAGKPLQKERWAGVVDAVGSYTLVERLRADAIWRCGCRLRPGSGHGFPGDGCAVYPARRLPAWH